MAEFNKLEPAEQRLLQTTIFDIQDTQAVSSTDVQTYLTTQQYYWYTLEKLYLIVTDGPVRNKTRFWYLAEKIQPVEADVNIWEDILPKSLDQISEAWRTDFIDTATQTLQLLLRFQTTPEAVTAPELDGLVDTLRGYSDH